MSKDNEYLAAMEQARDDLWEFRDEQGKASPLEFFKPPTTDRARKQMLEREETLGWERLRAEQGEAGVNAGKLLLARYRGEVADGRT